MCYSAKGLFGTRLRGQKWQVYNHLGLKQVKYSRLVNNHWVGNNSFIHISNAISEFSPRKENRRKKRKEEKKFELIEQSRAEQSRAEGERCPLVPQLLTNALFGVEVLIVLCLSVAPPFCDSFILSSCIPTKMCPSHPRLGLYYNCSNLSKNVCLQRNLGGSLVSVSGCSPLSLLLSFLGFCFYFYFIFLP